MKVKDGIIGLIVGDALGVPVEFAYKEELEKNPVVNMRGYGAWPVPKGTWSDDSSMTLATMGSIANKQGIDYDDIMNEFCKWHFKGKYTQDGSFDIGATISKALDRFIDGAPAIECGGTGERDNGNGSLMRILPLAFMKNIDYETIEDISALTHAHKRSKIACVLYVEMARSMMENDLTIKEHVDVASDKIKKYYKGSDELEHFKRIFNHDYSEGVSAKGYVITTFESVMYSLENTDNFRDAVLKAVNLGRDTDTVGAICGGLAGIYYGLEKIPVDWLNDIRDLDKVEALCERYGAFCDES